MAQRGLVMDVVYALEGWRKGTADTAKGVEFHVDPPDLRHSEFNFTEVIECALASVRKTAHETGAKVETALVGPLPEFVQGNAPHIHQLITMFAASLPEVGCAENLELQISFETKENANAQMRLSFLLSSTCEDPSLNLRLTKLIESFAAPQSTQCNGSELVLMSAWQLALALGASPSLETMPERKVNLEISLPLRTSSFFYSENRTEDALVSTREALGQPSDSNGASLADGGFEHCE
jgi:hypothetical protein